MARIGRNASGEIFSKDCDASMPAHGLIDTGAILALLCQLMEIVLATGQVREAPNEQLIRLPTGDGMAVFRHSAEEPARCAPRFARR